MNVIEKLFGTHSERELKMIRPIVAKIEGLRSEMMAKSDEELRDQTRIFKERLAKGETLDDLLPEAFATVREAASISLYSSSGVLYFIRAVLPRCVQERERRWYLPVLLI